MLHVKGITPILNVSDIEQSFQWFESLGWNRRLEWGDPLSFASVCSAEHEIFLCHGAQGGRGKGTNKETFGQTGQEDADKGVWLSLWVDDVDAVYQHCLSNSIDVTWQPADMPWGVREMHIRHPDGHVFRVSSQSQ